MSPAKFSGQMRLGVLLALFCLAPCPARAVEYVSEVLVLSGEAPPDNVGTYDEFEAPVLNNSGHVVFQSRNSESSGPIIDAGIYRAEGGSITQLIRSGDPALDGDGVVAGFNRILLNEAGDVSFEVNLYGTSDELFNDNKGVYLHDGAVTTQVARTEYRLSTDGVVSIFGHVLNDLGQTAVTARQNAGSAFTTPDRVIFLIEQGNASDLVRTDDVIPSGDGLFKHLGLLHLNEQGEAAFAAGLNTIGNVNDTGIYTTDGSTFTEIVREGQTTPDGNGALYSFGYKAANDALQVAFLANWEETAGGAFRNGIFLGDENSITELVRIGQPSPDGNGVFDSFSENGTGVGQPIISDSGLVAFEARLTNTLDGFSDTAVYVGDGQTLNQIARSRQPAQGGDGILAGFRDLTINEQGQIAFLARLANTSVGFRDSIYVGGQQSLMEVVRTGDFLLGSEIVGLQFSGLEEVGLSDEGRSGLNNALQVAYQFTLANGREGIAMASLIPEPSCFLLGSMTVTLLTLTSSRIRHSHRG